MYCDCLKRSDVPRARCTIAHQKTAFLESLLNSKNVCQCIDWENMPGVSHLHQVTSALTATSARNFWAFGWTAVGCEGHERSSKRITEGTDLRADASNELIRMESRRSKLCKSTKRSWNCPREKVVVKLQEKYIREGHNDVDSASEAVVVKVQLLERCEARYLRRNVTTQCIVIQI